MGQAAALAPDVLVLEPDALSCRYAVQALQQLGLQLQVSAGFAQGAASWQDCSPRLVVLGLDMDPADNLARLEQVRRLCPGAVIMGVCPRMASAERCELLNAGLDFILEKPFFVDECESAVRAILRRHPPLGQTVSGHPPQA